MRIRWHLTAGFVGLVQGGLLLKQKYRGKKLLVVKPSEEKAQIKDRAILGFRSTVAITKIFSSTTLQRGAHHRGVANLSS